MGIEEETRTFVEQMENLYFVQRDIKGLLAKMSQEISWLGTGENEISKSLLDAQQALEKEFEEYKGRFQILDQKLYTSKLSDKTCVIYGRIRAAPENDMVEEQNLHITAICSKTENGMKLVHCNMSRPDYIQEENRYYVPPRMRVENKQLRGKLENQEHWMQNLIRNIPGGMHKCRNDKDLTLVSISNSFSEMFGYTTEEIETQFENKFINMIYKEDLKMMLQGVSEQIAKGSTIELEYRVMSKNDGPIWILDKGRLMKDENEEDCFYCVLIEITQRKREQEQLRLSLERHHIIMDQAVDIIFEWDIEADTLDFSPNWRKKFGYNPIDKHISQKIPNSQNIHSEDMYAFVKIMRETAAGTPYSKAEFRIRDTTGHYRWHRIRATTQFDESGHAIKAVGVISDISAEKEERQALIELAEKDALTGIYNKGAIQKKVEQQWGEKNKEDMQALLIIDVDNFKKVNDTYGHLCGDNVLSDVAEVLKNYFRSSDLIGRIGGDEFLIYLPTVISEDAVRNKMETVLKELSKVKPSVNRPPVTCSVGAVVLPRKEMDYFSLYRAADNALYHRKNNEKNGISFYDPNGCDDSMTSELIHSAVSDSIDSEQLGGVEKQLVQYTFQMLYQSADVPTAVNQLLEIVGRAYGVSRVYIFESSEDGLYCNNTFEWCALGITAEMEHLQGIRYEEDLGGYSQNFNKEGIFYCSDISTLSPILYEILAPQGIRSLLQCAMRDKGEFKGYVGFDECKENCLWSKEQIRSLTFIANILSVFLIKLRLEGQLKKHNQKS